MLSGFRTSCRRLAINQVHKRRKTALKFYSSSTDSTTEKQASKLHQGVMRDLKRGNMWEYAQMKKHPDGKIFAGREVLAEQNMMWPEALMKLRGNGLIKKDEVDLESLFSKNASSFVLVSQKRPFAVNQIDSWTQPLRERCPTLPIVDLTVAHNLGYWWLNPALAALWKATDKVEATFGYMYASPLTSLTQNDFGIDIENGFFSYQFLVDSDFKIRWMSVGSANDSELERVVASTRRLTAEFNVKPVKRPPRRANSAIAPGTSTETNKPADNSL